ncbi:MAG: hypothetical protein JWR26_3307 [Pedosphaera sp.]|nr:hypothetical protein [Pedosphaera sp.]
MEAILRSTLLLIVCMSPSVLVTIGIIRKRRARRLWRESPFSKLKRRPAGEYLRLKLEVLDDGIDTWILWMVGFPTVVVLMAGVSNATGIILPVFAFCSSVICTVICGRKLEALTSERANNQLGFEGERYVGEELNRLAAVGFEVYHDVQFDGFNMDHVLVGSPGVFVVETKTRRMPTVRSGYAEGDRESVEFDGTSFRWPTGTDKYGLDQVTKNAQDLSKWLSEAVRNHVEVVPILTFPGWTVIRKIPTSIVRVLNPEEIVEMWELEHKRLDKSLMGKICHELNQKCRLAID